MLEELSKTVKAQLYERVSSPLLGSFLIAWCGWNYKFVLVLISSMDTEKKLAYINANLYPSMWDRVLEGFTYPLATSLALILLYPWPARWIFSYSRKQQVKLKKLQHDIDEETPLSVEEAREIRKSNAKVIEEFDREISLQKTQIERQKEQLMVATESLKERGDDKSHIAQLLEQLTGYQAQNESMKEELNGFYMKIKSSEHLVNVAKMASDKRAGMDALNMLNKELAAMAQRSMGFKSKAKGDEGVQ